MLLLCWPQQSGQPSRLHPDPALSHRHARLPAARRPAAAGLPAIPFYPSARPGMTHGDEQSMRRRAKNTHIDAPMPRQGIRVTFFGSHFWGSEGMVSSVFCWVADKTGKVHSGERKLL